MGEETEITEAEVKHVAWLARIELTREEKKLFTEQINTILEYFKIIREVDTENVSPTTHAIELISSYREDTIGASLEPQAALRNASKQERGFFKAPKII